MQCMAAAMATGAAATGIRAWHADRSGGWLRQSWLMAATGGVLRVGVLAAGLLV